MRAFSKFYRVKSQFLDLENYRICTWKYPMSNSCSRSGCAYNDEVVMCSHDIAGGKRTFTSNSRVAPRRSARSQDHHLQQDQQHVARFPRFIFRFDVAPHAPAKRVCVCVCVCASVSVCLCQFPKPAEIPPQLPPKRLYCYTYYGQLSSYRGNGSVGTCMKMCM